MRTKLVIEIDLTTSDGRDIPDTASPLILEDFCHSVDDADTIVLRAIRGAFDARHPGMDPRFILSRVAMMRGDEVYFDD